MPLLQSELLNFSEPLSGKTLRTAEVSSQIQGRQAERHSKEARGWGGGGGRRQVGRP